MKKLFLAMMLAWIMIATVGAHAANNLGGSNAVEDLGSKVDPIIKTARGLN